MKIMGRFPGVRKIACLRASGLGDFIASMPGLRALRATYPDAEICYLGRPMHAALLGVRPGPVDRVIVTPPKRGVREEPNMVENPAEIEAFFAAMRAERFDLAIQMHGGGRNSNPFLLQFGARHTLGWRTPDAPPLDRWMPYYFWQSEIMRVLELLRLAGVEATDFEPALTVTARDRAELGAGIPELAPRYMVLHVGAGDVRRRWPPERFALVGDALAAEGYQIVVIGTGDERHAVKSTIASMQQPAVDAYERLSLGGLLALMSGAALVVSNDSGPMHVALAVGAPTVGLYWCVNFMNWTHFRRSNFRPLASWITHCPDCGVDMTDYERPDTDCDHLHCFVGGITVDQALGAALALLTREERVPG